MAKRTRGATAADAVFVPARRRVCPRMDATLALASLPLPRARPPLHARAITRPVNAAADSTEQLLHRIRIGDPHARERLLARYLPMLRRWAHGRLPAHARDLGDTEDLVQATFLRALGRLDDFEYEGSGCFLGYLRHLLLNVLRNEIRRSVARGDNIELPETLGDDEGVSPLEAAVGRERLHRYERALAALPDRAQELLVMRIEFGLDYDEIAAETTLGRDAVRMAIKRAVAQLARTMGDGAS
jgi:RNA polymerase sigma-70 factor (ECF subfamily)